MGQPEIKINENINWVSVNNIYINTKQDVIVTTEPKLRGYLSLYAEYTEYRTKWLAPLGIVISIGVAFPTATFQHFIFEASFWKAFFTISEIAAIVWFVMALRKVRKAKTIDEVIDEVKRDSECLQKQ